MTAAGERSAADGAAGESGGLRYRPATSDDLDACTAIWRAGIDDYQGRLNQPPMPAELGPLRSLFGHFLATDPERFWVATAAARGLPADVGVALDRDGRRRVGFGSATIRDRTWFLGMLFVLPGEQATGVGSELLRRTFTGTPGEAAVREGWTFGTCTDAAQPISNALYARAGLTPRVPIWRLAGELRDRAALATLPRGFTSEPFADSLDGDPARASALRATVATLDRATLGAAHPADHAALRRDGREGLLVRGRGGEPVGYGYASGTGRLGPFAALEPGLLAPIVGALAASIPGHAERSLWLPTIAGDTLQMLLRAGLRLDGFPGLLCWSNSATPFDRYVPISLALL